MKFLLTSQEGVNHFVFCHSFRPDQVFWLWTRRSDPVWYQKRPLHRQRIPWGEQVAGHAGWVYQKICAVYRVRQPWNWSGKCLPGAPVSLVVFFLFVFLLETNVQTMSSVCHCCSMSIPRNKPSALPVRPVETVACWTLDTNCAHSSSKTHQVRGSVV